MEDSNLLVARYAVVAHIESVDEYEQTSQSRQERKPRSMAEGECLGILPVGQYFGDMLELLPEDKAGSTR